MPELLEVFKKFNWKSLHTMNTYQGVINVTKGSHKYSGLFESVTCSVIRSMVLAWQEYDMVILIYSTTSSLL